MRRDLNRFDYLSRGVRVGTPLGFFALVLVTMVPVLAGLALAISPLRVVLITSLLVYPVLLALWIAFCSVKWPGALRGVRPVVRNRNAALRHNQSAGKAHRKM